MERLLAKKSRRGYRAVLGHLKKAHKLYSRLDRPEDFRRRVADLRLANANRPTLLAELDRL